jgi:hypothetical protein
MMHAAPQATARSYSASFAAGVRSKADIDGPSASAGRARERRAWCYRLKARGLSDWVHESAIGRRVRDLENEVGAALFIRRRAVPLTFLGRGATCLRIRAAGRAHKTKCRRVSSCFAAVACDIAVAAPGIRGRLRTVLRR